MAKVLPFVPDELIAQAKMDFIRSGRQMAKDNPYLFQYIYGFIKHIEAEGEFTKENVFNFGLSIYELLRLSGEDSANDNP